MRFSEFAAAIVGCLAAVPALAQSLVQVRVPVSVSVSDGRQTVNIPSVARDGTSVVRAVARFDGIAQGETKIVDRCGGLGGCGVNEGPYDATLSRVGVVSILFAGVASGQSNLSASSGLATRAISGNSEQSIPFSANLHTKEQAISPSFLGGYVPVEGGVVGQAYGSGIASAQGPYAQWLANTDGTVSGTMTLSAVVKQGQPLAAGQANVAKYQVGIENGKPVICYASELGCDSFNAIKAGWKEVADNLRSIVVGPLKFLADKFSDNLQDTPTAQDIAGFYFASNGGQVASMGAAIADRLAADPPRDDYASAVERLTFGFDGDPGFADFATDANSALYDLTFGLQSYELYLEAIEKMQGAHLAGNQFYVDERLIDAFLYLNEAELSLLSARDKFAQIASQNDPDGLFGVLSRGADTARLGIGMPVSGVPEPSSWVMLIFGFGLIGGAMRRAISRSAVRAACFDC